MGLLALAAAGQCTAADAATAASPAVPALTGTIFYATETRATACISCHYVALLVAALFDGRLAHLLDAARVAVRPGWLPRRRRRSWSRRRTGVVDRSRSQLSEPSFRFASAIPLTAGRIASRSCHAITAAVLPGEPSSPFRWVYYDIILCLRHP